MKIIHTFCLLLLCSWVSAQSYSWSVGLLGGIDWNKSEYTFPLGFVEQTLPSTFPQGHNLGLRISKKIDERFSFSTGLSYSQKNFYPRLMLGGFYGTIVINPLDSNMILHNPYLKEHRFSLLQIPLQMQYHFAKNSKVNPYVSVGFLGSFRFNEVEHYQDNFVQFGEQEGLEFAIENSDFAFFGLAFNVGLGLSIAMGDNLSLLIEHSGNIWEYRKGNEKFKENGEMLFESKILALSRLSLNLGVAYKF